MGNLPGFVLLAGFAVAIVVAIVRSSRRRNRRRAVIRTLAAVLNGTVDKRGHAVGTWGPYRIEAFTALGGATPTELSSSGGHDQVIPQLYVQVDSPSGGGGAWSCRREPSLWPGRPAAVTFVENPIGLLPGARSLLNRLGVEQLDEGGRYRLAQAGLLDAIDALGQGASRWLPQVYRMPSPELPGALMANLAAAGHDAGRPGGVHLNCRLELGPEITAEQFRAVLDKVVRIVEIDAAANR